MVKIYKIFIFLTLLFPIIILSQVKGDLLYIYEGDTSHVPFMYIGSDNLDYSDGGTTLIGIEVNSLIKDSLNNLYILEGKIFEKRSRESCEDYGLVTIGKIELITANTWLGKVQTGLLIRDSEFINTKNGMFTIRIPIDYNNLVIFTAEGGSTIVDIPFRKLLETFLLKQ